MLYEDYLKTLTKCPFCDCKDRMIKENKEAFLTYSKAPYHKHHLLVIPRRHTELYLDITDTELDAIQELLHHGMKLLKAIGYKNISMLVRDGDNTGKSIQHMHFHIVPNVLIGDLDHYGNPRMILSPEEIDTTLRAVNTKTHPRVGRAMIWYESNIRT